MDASIQATLRRHNLFCKITLLGTGSLGVSQCFKLLTPGDAGGSIRRPLVLGDSSIDNKLKNVKKPARRNGIRMLFHTIDAFDCETIPEHAETLVQL